MVIRTSLPARTELGEGVRLPVHWTIAARGGVVAEGAADNRSLVWPVDLPEGSYRLQLTDADGAAEEAPLIVAPERAFAGDFDRGWVIAVQLYGVRSGRNWGMGDFTDLEHLIRLASQLGADGIGLNPLHVLFDDRPGDCSPYSPNSRLFLNALYIDVEKAPGYRPLPDGDALARLRQTTVVDYPAVAALKWRALRVGLRDIQRRSQASVMGRFRLLPPGTRRAAAAFCLLRNAAPSLQGAVVGMARGMAAARRDAACRARGRPRSQRGRVRRLSCSGSPTGNWAAARSSPTRSA